MILVKINKVQEPKIVAIMIEKIQIFNVEKVHEDQNLNKKRENEEEVFHRKVFNNQERNKELKIQIVV